MRSKLNLFYVLVSGLGIGWLMGWAVTPVLNTVLTGVMGVAVSVVSILIGLPESGESTVTKNLARTSVLPLMLLIVGLATGATVGLYGRVNGWVFSSEQRAALVEPDASAGAMIPMVHATGGLFTDVVPEECARFESQIDYPAQLQGELATSRNSLLRTVALSPAADSALLVQLVEAACTEE